MKYELLDRPDFTMARVEFERAGEVLRAESSVMVAMDSTLGMQTGATGGVGSALKRSVFTGDSFFENTYTASRAGETLFIAPAAEGDVEVVELANDETILLSSGAYLACGEEVTLTTKWEGAKGFFAGTGLFLGRAEGPGPIFFGGYGGVHAIEIGKGIADNGYICDTSHVLAFDAALSFDVRKIAGLRASLFSGEGLVCEFRGQGRLFVSTRSPRNIAGLMHGFRR